MLNFIVEFLSTRVAPNNTVLQFLKTILESSILGRMATGLFTLFVMAFFSWAYYKRNKEDYASLTGDSDIWGVCSKSFGYWMGITVILLAFQTNFAFDIFLSFIDLFSD